VLEFSAQGLTQQEIARELMVSQETVSNDIISLKKVAVEFVKRNREHLAFEYKKAKSVFDQLMKEAWKHCKSTLMRM
jgi:transcriptional regulator